MEGAHAATCEGCVDGCRRHLPRYCGVGGPAAEHLRAACSNQEGVPAQLIEKNVDALMCSKASGRPLAQTPHNITHYSALQRPNLVPTPHTNTPPASPNPSPFP